MGQMIPATESWATQKSERGLNKKQEKNFIASSICQKNEEWVYFSILVFEKY